MYFYEFIYRSNDSKLLFFVGGWSSHTTVIMNRSGTFTMTICAILSFLSIANVESPSFLNIGTLISSVKSLLHLRKQKSSKNKWLYWIYPSTDRLSIHVIPQDVITRCSPNENHAFSREDNVIIPWHCIILFLHITIIGNQWRGKPQLIIIFLVHMSFNQTNHHSYICYFQLSTDNDN